MVMTFVNNEQSDRVGYVQGNRAKFAWRCLTGGLTFALLRRISRTPDKNRKLTCPSRRRGF